MRCDYGTRNDAGDIFVCPLRIRFIIFVDAIFTTLFERLFTKVFEVIAQTTAISCLYPARTTD
jgi:hypothetical protein